MSRLALGSLTLLPLLACGGCGPSFQAVYEGDQRFERCYALDDNPNAPMQEKATCWRDWLRNYTYGQTRDRVEYAAVRQRTLQRVPELPTDEAMMEAAPGEVRTKAAVAAPAPTSAFAPPPKTLSDMPDAGARIAPSPMPSVVFVAPQSSTASAPAPVPASDCQNDCTHRIEACRANKKPDACDKEYRGCMRACFK
jgi:hypothetical protein